MRPRWSWVAAGLLAAAGVAAVASRPLAAAVPSVASLGTTTAALTSFDANTTAAVAAWNGPLRAARLVSITLHLAVPLALVGTSRGRALLDRIGGSRAASWRGAATVVVVLAVATAPLRVWIGWFHAGSAGFRTSGVGRFVVEALADVGLELVVSATGAALLVALVRRRPDDWPALGALGGTALTALLVLVAPWVVTELLLSPRPLDDPALEVRIGEVVAASDVAAQRIEVGEASVRTTRANAVVTGIGPARRVLLYDTLLDRPTDAVAAVVAHELAHVEHRDVERAVLTTGTGLLLVLVGARTALGAWRRRGASPTPAVAGAVVVAAAVVLQVTSAPLVAWESRRAESAADARALELTDDPAAMVTLQRGFVTEELSDPFPPTWVRLLRSHPTAAQRIARAVVHAQERGLDPTPATTP